MDSYFRPTWVEISLDALRHNYTAFRKIIPQTMKIMAVVKANGYGHGAIAIAQEALDCGADYLGVAFLDEAMELRLAGIASPILVLGYTPPEGIDLARVYDITITVFSEEILDSLEGLLRGDLFNEGSLNEDRFGEGSLNEGLLKKRSSNEDPLKKRSSMTHHPVPERRLKIHIKLDTGMGRLGLRVEHEDEAIQFIERALRIQSIIVEGLYTHYACADETDASYTYGQYRRFQRIVEFLQAKGVEFPILHAGNSATAIQFPELSCNMIRLGISLYGLYPSEEVDHHTVELQPVMSFKTAVIMVKYLPPHSGVSYGAIYHTTGEEQIATLPVGYADGFTRMLTGCSEALIRGQKVPIVGRICMDQCMINVTDVPEVRMGEEVVLFGRQGEAVITADDLADKLGTINYEITCMISNRVPRTYIKNGQICDVLNPIFKEQDEITNKKIETI